MLGRKLQYGNGRQAGRRRHRRIATHRLLARVDDDARRRRPARHRCQHRKRRREIDVVVREVVHIAENGAADLHFGHAGLLRTIGKGTRAAAAHDLDSIACFPAGAGTRREQGDGGADRTLLLRRIADGRGVGLPSHHTRETQTGAIGDLARERNNRCARLDARAVHADVDLDRHAQPLVGSREGRIELREILDAVGTDDRVGAIGQIDQPADLDRPHDLVGDQDIADARGGHHLGFAQLRARDAGRAGSDLDVCDLRRHATPCARHVATMRAMFASMTSRSTSSAGVSSADLCWPMRLYDAAVRVSMCERCL